jgi:D-amino peptidase
MVVYVEVVMKIYVCTDIEGCCGVDHWDEATIGQPGYAEGSRQLSLEAAAACEAAIAAGADEVLLQDAHDSGRNIDLRALPKPVRVSRGWSDEPRCMAQELDASFDALVLVGQHSGPVSGGNPLAHCFSLKTHEVFLNGEEFTESLMLHYMAGYFKVPLVFLSGDEAVCSQIKRLNPGMEALAVKEGVGNSSISINPDLAIELTRDGVEKAIRARGPSMVPSLPGDFTVEIEYTHHGRANKMSFYPGMERLSPRRLRFRTRDYYEVLRMMLFTGYGPG